MARLLRNRSYTGVDIDSLGYGLSVAKPALVDNGPVLFKAVKPVTDWSRYFFDGEHAAISGFLRTDWYDGTRLINLKIRHNTGLGNEQDVRWLPGTPTSWNTASPFSQLWIGELDVGDFDSLKLRAIAEAKTAGWDLGTLYAERKKLLELIRHLVSALLSQGKRVLHALPSYSAMRWFLRDRGENGAGAIWLHARYGLRPLVFDLLEAYERLTKVHEELFRVTESDSRGDTVVTEFDPGSLSGANAPSGWTFAGGIPSYPLQGVGTFTVTRNVSARCGIGVRSVVKGKFTVNPALTAWEIVPFSFVVDWALNIGDNILAWAPVFDRTLEYGWMTLRDEFIAEAKADFSGTDLFGGLAKPSGTTSNLYFEGKSRSTLVCSTTVMAHSYRRVRIDLADVPHGVDFGSGLDWFKTLDLTALFNQNKRSWARLLKKINF